MTTPSGRVSRRIPYMVAPIMLAALALAGCSAGALPATTSPATAPPVASGGRSDGGGELIVPKPGQLDVHPISAGAFAARVDGHHVVLIITYTSGIEPCSVLDTIVVERGSGSFAITLREGHGPGNQVCIMIAKVMKTQVDLGDLDPGTYSITDATGGAAAIQVIVN
jgi:hypothetical protein